MSCCYCGKRVSLVRKRVDPDFCCDEHREKYHARTRRSIETLRQADEHSAVTRRLNEGLPVLAPMPRKGRDPDSLLMKSPGEAAQFGGVLFGLPASRPELETHVPRASLTSFRLEQRQSVAPASRHESVRWNLGATQQDPRPPRPFTITIRLPQGGPKRVKVQQAACDRPRCPRTGPAVALGGSVAIARTMNRRLQRHSLHALMRSVRPPAPVQPPPPAPPIVVTLRHPTMAVCLGHPHRAHRVTVRMPEPGISGMRFTPPPAQQRPAISAYVPIVRRDLFIPGVPIGPGGMPRAAEPRGAQRSTPCPEGFRRRQYYAWEALERFCAIGFQTIAANRPEIEIVAAPAPTSRIDLARKWAVARQDPATAEPERRRPAPPFREQLCVPAGVSAHIGCELRHCVSGPLKVQALDSSLQLPSMRPWDGFPGRMLVRHQGALGAVSPVHSVRGTAETMGIAAWAKPQNRGAKRMSSHLSIGARKPVFAGPAFAAGRRQAGPCTEKRSAPPVFAPAPARARSTSVVTPRPVLLPASERLYRGMRHMPILDRACQAPVGHVTAASIVHPAQAIALPVALPADRLRATAVGGLSFHAPARMTGSAFDIAKGTPEMVARLTLERFRRRGYEGMHSRHSPPHWPARSTPGLLALDAQSAQPHAAHGPERETAVTMYRTGDLPAASRFQRACALMNWGTQPPPLPGPSDWGRAPRLTAVAQPLPFVLPVDSLGPIRDWGLAPPPEPEKPPEPIHEDFAAGLTNWVCANADWKQDIAGVRTGSLALLRPSLNMRDYEIEFLGKIENQSIGWVFRAANTSNYYALRLALDGDSAQLVRFAVLAGDREEPVQARLQVPVAQNASCRVKMSVTGDEFKLFINDKPACEWNDDRLPEGGVGFFSDGEDRARLYWVKVTPFYEAPADDLYHPIAGLRSEFHREIRMGV